MNIADVTHLARRWAGSLSTRPPSLQDTRWACSMLVASERALWLRMPAVDRRHSIAVARRFVAMRSTAPRAEVAAALLHDVGKIDASLGTTGRVLATLVGPRGTRFRRYYDHETIGARWLAELGSDPVTVGLVGGHGPEDAARALRAADDL